MNNTLIVIPAFDEEATIEKVVLACKKFGKVLVVDDGSKDQTSLVAEKAGALVIISSINKGYDSALNLGYQYALHNNFDVMITIDADGQLPVDRLPFFIKDISNGADIVVGVRSYLPRFCEKFLAIFSKSLLNLQDPYCGMKAYRLDFCLIKKIFSTYNSIGTDLALTIALKGGFISNIPISIKVRSDQSRFGNRIVSEFRLFPSMFFGISRIVLHKLRLRNLFSKGV
jgi:glycosyltransferase involved in cell wall biosynthesis